MLKPMREFVRELCQQQGCSDKSLDCMVMAINEACMNVIQHAYHGKEDEEIIIEFWKDGEQMLIKIFDFADSVDPASIESLMIFVREGWVCTLLIRLWIVWNIKQIQRLKVIFLK